MDNEFYNNGIVDVSYEYEKIYVIRPQFFIPMITLLRNVALNFLQYKQELSLMREQNIDITNFENDLDLFKTAFAKNYDLASRKFKAAIDEIDKTITHKVIIYSYVFTQPKRAETPVLTVFSAFWLSKTGLNHEMQ